MPAARRARGPRRVPRSRTAATPPSGSSRSSSAPAAARRSPAATALLGARVPPPPGRPHGVPHRGRRRGVLRPAQPAARARSVRRAVRRRVPRLRARRAGSRRPTPSPPVQIAPRARLWSPPDTDPRRPLPLLVVHDGGDYERLAELPRLIAHAIATEPDPALPRRAARPRRPRRGLLRLRPLRAHAGRHRCRSSPPRPRTPGSARASARSRSCTPAGCTPARSAR